MRYYLLEKYRQLKLIGLDADEEACSCVRPSGALRGPGASRRKAFRDLGRILREASATEVDAVLFDLGISMYQMSGGRGFSFWA